MLPLEINSKCLFWFLRIFFITLCRGDLKCMTLSSVFWIFFITAFLECQIWSFWSSCGPPMKIQAIFRLWIFYLLEMGEVFTHFLFKKRCCSNSLLSVNLELKANKQTNKKTHLTKFRQSDLKQILVSVAWLSLAWIPAWYHFMGGLYISY